MALSVDEVLTLVRERGGRVTDARRAVVGVLVDGGHEHLTAEVVAERVGAAHPEVHLSTVYRTLEALEELGVVSHVHLGHGPSTYHLSAEPHHHAACDRCGTVVHLPGDLFDDVVARVGREAGFVAASPHFSLTGLCADCARASGPRS